MRWQGRQGSGNVEDRRGIGGGGIAVGGGIIGVIVLLFNLLTGGEVDPSQIPIGGDQQTSQQSPQQKAQEDQLAQFTSVVLRETETVWQEVLPQQAGVSYQDPRLVLFTNSVQSACGSASSATGPFYCPGDNKIYIDLSFHRDLSQRFGASGDFAMAYVIAHEVGHHVQNLLGTSTKVARLRSQLPKAEYNRYSVMLELQADFYAGLWAHYVQGKGLLEQGDIEEALRAANAIGDDRLQKQAQGHVVPESFTHGTSAQRMQWFKRGYQSGDMRQGNTFEDPNLR